MAHVTLTKSSLAEGVWEGMLLVDGDDSYSPALQALHLDQPVPGLTVAELPHGGGWSVSLPIPLNLISDGVQTFVIVDTRTGDQLASFALLAGEALAEDIRAEMDLLRAELDMLKRAFRRHCLETT